MKSALYRIAWIAMVAWPVDSLGATSCASEARASEARASEEREVALHHAGNEEEPAAFGATLVLPDGEGPHPAILLVSPAGEHPRDELRRDGAHYADLGRRLAAQGIASLRVDNRGVGASRNATWPAWSWDVSMEELAQDLAGHFDWLRRRPQVDFHRVGVLAHGDGVVPAALLAADRVPGARRPAFTILLSASGRRGTIDLTQRMAGRVPNADVDAPAIDALQTALDQLVDEGPSEEVVAALAACLPSFGVPEAEASRQAQGFAEGNGERWHREYLGYEPSQTVREIEGPLLVLLADDDPRLDAQASEALLSDAFRGGALFQARCERLKEGGHFLEPAQEPRLRREVVERVCRFVTEATGFEARGVEDDVSVAGDPPGGFLIADVTVVDVEAGELVPHRWVHLRDGVVVSIDDGEPPTEMPVTRVEGRGRYLIPGLWDCHAHISLWGRDALARFVRSGVTSVRDMGGDLDELRAWRSAIDRGERLGPRLLLAGPFLDGDKPNDLYRRFVLDAAQAQAAVDEVLASGADFLKVHSQLAPDVFAAIGREAERRGCRFAGHVPVGVLPTEASAAGITSIEHADTFFSSLARAPRSPAASWPEARAWWQGDEGRAALADIADNGTVVVPTLVTLDTAAERHAGLFERVAPWTLEITAALHEAGVPIAAGSDTARRLIGIVPGASLHRELELLVDAGLTPAEALRAATLVPARRFGANAQGGVIAVGAPADLVLLGGNPLQDIAQTRSVQAVFVRGRRIEG